MKKVIIVFVLATIALSCASPKTVIQSKKVIKGYWTLDNVKYSELGNFKTILFDDATKECFEGSTWRFIPNNNSGIYTINGDNCVKGERYFIFTIQEINKDTGYYDFLLKPTDEKHNSEDNRGFRLQLTQLSDTTMQWEQTVSVDGNPLKISMNFTKINE